MLRSTFCGPTGTHGCTKEREQVGGFGREGWSKRGANVPVLGGGGEGRVVPAGVRIWSGGGCETYWRDSGRSLLDSRTMGLCFLEVSFSSLPGLDQGNENYCPGAPSNHRLQKNPQGHLAPRWIAVSTRWGQTADGDGLGSHPPWGHSRPGGRPYRRALVISVPLPHCEP